MARNRRQTDWHGVAIRGEALGTTGANTGFVTVASAAQLDKYSNPTVTRVLGTLFQGVSRNTGTQDDLASILYLGLAVVHQDLSGGRDIVNQFNDDDWMWTGLHIMGMTRLALAGGGWDGSQVQVAGAGFGSLHLPYAPLEFDTRAMRRCGDPLELRLYWQQFVDGADFDVTPTLEGYVRALIKE